MEKFNAMLMIGQTKEDTKKILDVIFDKILFINGNKVIDENNNYIANYKKVPYMFGLAY